MTPDADKTEDRENREFASQADFDPMLREGGITSNRSRSRRVARSFEELTTADRTRYLEIEGDASTRPAATPSMPAAAAAASAPSALKITLKRPRKDESISSSTFDE